MPTSNDRRVLVTGGTGLIGTPAVDELCRRGWDVHLFGRSLPSGADSTEIDLLSGGEVHAAVQRVQPTHLLHLAWTTKHGEFWTSRDNVDWMTATIRLARAFADAGGRRAVFAGTCAEYDWSTGHMVEGVTPIDPATLYGRCKGGTRQAVIEFCRDVGVSAAWGRIFFLFGDRTSGEDARRLIPSILLPVLEGKLAVVRSGAHVRDLLPAADVGRAFVDLLESELIGPINVASGEPITLGDVARTIGRAAGRPDLVTVEDGPGTPANPRVLTADVTRLRSTGFRPARSAVESLEQLVHAWKSP